MFNEWKKFKWGHSTTYPEQNMVIHIGIKESPYSDDEKGIPHTLNRMATYNVHERKFYECPNGEPLDLLNRNKSLEFYWCYSPLFYGEK